MNFNYNDHHNPENIKKFIKFIFVIVIIMTMIPIVILFKSQSTDSDKKYKEYTFPVYAEIVDIVTEDNNGKPIEESPVFLYEYNGQKYRVTVLNVEKNYYSIGQTVEIKLIPYDPGTFYDPIYIKDMNKGNSTGFIIIICFFMIPVILVIFGMRKTLKNSDTIAKRFAEGYADSMEAQQEAVQRELNPDNQYDYSDTNNYGTDNYNDSYDAYNSTDYGDSLNGTNNNDYQSSYDTSFDSYETPKKKRGITVMRTTNNTPAKNIIAIIACLIFIGVGLFVVFLGRNDKKQCTEPVNATVSDIIKKTSGSRKNRSTGYYPTYKFEYENRTYEVKSKMSTPKTKQLHVGENVKIYIDPDDPNHVYLAGDSSASILGYVFVGIGGFILFVIIWDIVNKKRKRSNNGNDSYYQ